MGGRMGVGRPRLPMTAKQADLLYRLVDSYVDAAVETQENRSDLGLAKRIRVNLGKTFGAKALGLTGAPDRAKADR